jgi:ribosomal protein L19E
MLWRLQNEIRNKKALVARTLNVGKGRMLFNTTRLSEIKEAIPARHKGSSCIRRILSLKRRKEMEERFLREAHEKTWKRSTSKKLKDGKAEYIIITRKLRRYVANLKSRGQITSEESVKLRKEIRTRAFKSLAHMKERIKGGKQ